MFWIKFNKKNNIKYNICNNDNHEKVLNESYRANTNMGDTISIHDNREWLMVWVQVWTPKIEHLTSGKIRNLQNTRFNYKFLKLILQQLAINDHCTFNTSPMQIIYGIHMKQTFKQINNEEKRLWLGKDQM